MRRITEQSPWTSVGLCVPLHSCRGHLEQPAAALPVTAGAVPCS